MVSTFAKPRDSLRETLFLLPSPQRRGAAPATASAKTGEPGGVRTKKALRVMVREVRLEFTQQVRHRLSPVQ